MHLHNYTIELDHASRFAFKDTHGECELFAADEGGKAAAFVAAHPVANFFTDVSLDEPQDFGLTRDDVSDFLTAAFGPEEW